MADAENLTAAEEEEQKKRAQAKLGEEAQLNGNVNPTDKYVLDIIDRKSVLRSKKEKSNTNSF